MNTLLKTLIVWLMLVAIPFQGFATAGMPTCASMQAAPVAVTPEHCHDMASAMPADDGADHTSSLHHTGGKCSSCASCCFGAAMAPSVPGVRVPADTPVVNPQPLLAAMNQLGMPLYGCQTPDGYKNTQEAWLNPDALSRRITFATALAAGRLPLDKVPAPVAPPADGMTMNVAMAAPVPGPKPPPPVPLDPAMLEATLGSTVSPRALAIVADSAAPLRAAMLLGSPDFMQY